MLKFIVHSLRKPNKKRGRIYFDNLSFAVYI